MKYRSVTGYTTRSCEDTHINSFSAISVEKRLKNVKFEEQLRKSNFFSIKKHRRLAQTGRRTIVRRIRYRAPRCFCHQFRRNAETCQGQRTIAKLKHFHIVFAQQKRLAERVFFMFRIRSGSSSRRRHLYGSSLRRDPGTCS